MNCNANHELVHPLHCERRGIDVASFEKHQSRLNAGVLITIEACLTLGAMKRVRSGDLVDISSAIVIDILRSRDGRLQPILIADAMNAAKSINLVFVDCVDDRPSQKLRIAGYRH